MRLHTSLAVGTLLAIQAVGAVPIRLTVVSSEIHAIGAASADGSPVASVRLGHALTSGPFVGGGVLSEPPKKHGCGLRGKAMELSESLRKAFGLDTTINEEEASQELHILPIFTNDIPKKVAIYEESDKPEVATLAHPHYRLRPQDDFQPDEENFVERIHTALVALGPWEARAVAFVLGCGIGVLFRMIWVFAVLLFRNGREEESDDVQYTLVIEQVRDAEELPPKYMGTTSTPSNVDEKAAARI